MTAGAITITPKMPVPLAGRIGRVENYTSVFSPLEANLIALPTTDKHVLLIGIDLLFASDDFKQRVLSGLETKTKQRIEDIVFIASHTHNAPAVDATKPKLGRVDDGYLAYATQQVTQLISDVFKSKTSHAHEILRGMATCSLNASRRKRGLRLRLRPLSLSFKTNMVVGKTDPDLHDLTLLIGRDSKGEPIWVIWHWPCHATASPDSLSVSSDFPGVVRQEIRHLLGKADLPMIYLPGASADLRPNPSYFPVSAKDAMSHLFQKPFAKPTAKNFKRLGETLSSAVSYAVKSASSIGTLDSAVLLKRSVRLDQLIDGHNNNQQAELEIHALDVGKFGILMLGAEVASAYRACFKNWPVNKWLMTGCCNQTFGYLPSNIQIAEGGYESEGFFDAFSLTGRFMPKIEHHITHIVADLQLQTDVPKA